MEWLNQDKQLLSKLWRNNTLPHAMIFNGAVGSGINVLAHWLMSIIACEQSKQCQNETIEPCGHCKACLLMEKSTYPDAISIEQDTRIIGVDEIRQLCSFFEKTAQIGQAKTAMIDQAEKMTIAASNALLKTLEEPNNQCFIFLTSHDVDLLLPTITSRCRIIAIRPTVASFLETSNNNVNGDEFSNVTHMPELTDQQQAEKFSEFCHLVDVFFSSGEQSKELIEQLIQQPSGLRWLENIIVQSLRIKENWKNHQQPMLSYLPNALLYQLYRLICQSSMKVKMLNQVNRDMLLAQLVFDAEKLIKTGE